MKTKTPQHTPTPWGHAGAQLIGNEAREMIGLLKNTDAGTDAQANAAYIVKAVNSRETLIKGILELRDRLTMAQDSSGNSEINQDEIELCNSLLTKAEAQS